MFNTLFYQPIFNTVVFIYNLLPWPDLGLTIILFTCVLKIALWSLSASAIKSQKQLQSIQGDIEKIKIEYKDKKEEMTRAMMALYKEKNINPFSSCLPVFIQLPFLFAVFMVLQKGMESQISLLYPFIHRPEVFSDTFLGLMNLSVPYPGIALLAALAQFWQTKMIMNKSSQKHDQHTPKQELAEAMNKQMLYLMPALTFFIGFTLPGGVSLYWLVSTLIGIFQQYLLFNSVDKPEVA